MSATVGPPGSSKRICDLLLKLGVLRQEQYEATIRHVKDHASRPEDAVIELGFVGEADLLKALSTYYKTYFVSTERLAKADIVKATLDLIPRRFAESATVFPVAFDPQTHALSVVMAEPDNLEVLREIELASSAKEIKAFLARPAAVRAAIAKAYGGDIHAFALLDRQAHAQFSAMLDVYERNLVSDASMATSLAREAPVRGRERVLSGEELARNATGVPSARGGFSTEGTLELLNVLVSLLESSRQDLRGHSAQVARLARQLADRLSLDPVDASTLSIAAYVHDLGKMGHYHLTPYNVGEYDGHRVAAQKSHASPLRLLEPVRLPTDALDAVRHLYERYDGKGFPEGLSGKDIPLFSRVLAICDTYADLTRNPKNPFRKALSAIEACEVLGQHRERYFDPNLVDLFRHTVTGENLRARLLSNKHVALLIDDDPEETTILELRMIEQGFAVKATRTEEQALQILAAGEIDLVVSEIELGQTDGLALLAKARKQPWGKDLAWVVYTRRQEKEKAQRAFELGVLDFVNKPTNVDVLVAKLKALLDQRATPRANRGVSGSLREMALPDLIQVAFHARKTGNLRIRGRGEQGEIHLDGGNVVNAFFGELRGTSAFYAMLKVTDGEFALDPSFKPPSRVITESPEALLLEGMRRMDEGLDG